MILDFLNDWRGSSQFRLIMWISGIFLVIKLIFLFGIPIIPHAIEDWYIAKHIAQGSGYSLSNGPTALKTPIYPLFLTPAAFFGDFGKLLASCLQHILLFLSTLFFFKAGILRFGRNFAFVSTLIYTLHPAYVYYPFVLESTALTIPLCILFWFMGEYSKSQSRNVKSTILLGWLIALNQPILLPGIFALQLFYFGKKENLLTLIVTAVIIFAPWTIRNAMTFGSFIPSKSPMWMNLYEGMQNDVSFQEHKQIEFSRKYMNDVQLEKEYKPIVLRQFTQHFAVYFERSMHRFTEFWMIPDRYKDQIVNPTIIFSRILPQSLLGIGFILSVIFIFGKKSTLTVDNRHFLILLIGIMLYVSIIYSLTQASNIRFKLDIEWMQILLLFPIFQGFPKLAEFVGTRK